MQECAGDWPLSIDQKCFDYLQIIWAWIKLSPLTITFRHVKGHQTDRVSYDELDWWANATRMSTYGPKLFFKPVRLVRLLLEDLMSNQLYTL